MDSRDSFPCSFTVRPVEQVVWCGCVLTNGTNWHVLCVCARGEGTDF